MHDDSRSVDPLVSQRLDRLEATQCPALSRSGPLGNRRCHSEAVDQVEDHDAQMRAAVTAAEGTLRMPGPQGSPGWVQKPTEPLLSHKASQASQTLANIL